MEIKVNDTPIPRGYFNLDDFIKSWGDKGRRIYDGWIRQRNGISDKDIHIPTNGNSFQSEESPTPFLVNVN